MASAAAAAAAASPSSTTSSSSPSFRPHPHPPPHSNTNINTNSSSTSTSTSNSNPAATAPGFRPRRQNSLTTTSPSSVVSSSGVSSSLSTTPTAATTTPPPNPTPCDACFHRRSRCAMNESINKCYSCDFHRQDCTFAVSSQLGKRKLDDAATASNTPSNAPSAAAAFMPVKRRSRDAGDAGGAPAPTASASASASRPVSDPSPPPSPSQLLRVPVTGQHIGLTTELEPLVLDYLPLDQNNECQLAASRVRKFTDEGTFMRVLDGAPPTHPPLTGAEKQQQQQQQPSQSPPLSLSIEGVDNLVAPCGHALIDEYFKHVHPVFPILVEDSFRRCYHAKTGFSPALLAAVYLVALKFLDTGPSGLPKPRTPDPVRLESATCRLLNEALAHPTSLSALQAGLLVSQKSTLFTPALMAQLVTVAFDLGLHQDCSDWKLHPWERGLRKRLSWALYVQDKWCALVHGRPSHIFAPNWTVRELTPQDFCDAYPPAQANKKSAANRDTVDHNTDSSGVGTAARTTYASTTFSSSSSPVSGAGDGGTVSVIFRELVDLTRILSDVLDTFYTLQAAADFSAAGDHSTRVILERAKPIQIRLKDWFARLPAEVKIDSNNTNSSSASGGLHLAYFATEITLHRCIVRSLGPNTADDCLTHICRSAAKTRLISAMDLVNRLRPTHLRSFWSSAARTNFALIGAFGILLLVTAETREEDEFYRTRLGEYRWTLSVNCRDAPFLAFAIDSLDVSTNLLRDAPGKPMLDEVLARSASEMPSPSAQAQPQRRRKRNGSNGNNSRPRVNGVRFRDEEETGDGAEAEDSLDGATATSRSASSSNRRRAPRSSSSTSAAVSGLVSPAASTMSSSTTISPIGAAPSQNMVNGGS